MSDLFIKKEYRSPITNLINLYKFSINNTDGLIFHSSNENSEFFYRRILQNKIYFWLVSVGTPLNSKLFTTKKKISKIISVLLEIYFFILKSINFFLFKCKIKIIADEKVNFDFHMEEIQEKNKKKKYPFFLRSKEYFEWRYSIYKFKKKISVFRNKKLIGYLIIVGSNVLDLNNLIILDIQFNEKLNFFEKLKLKFFLISLGRNNNFDTIYSLGNKRNPVFNQLFSFPFFKIPDHLLPHSNPMFIHNLNDENEEKNIKNIHFTISDFDYF